MAVLLCQLQAKPASNNKQIVPRIMTEKRILDSSKRDVLGIKCAKMKFSQSSSFWVSKAKVNVYE